MAAPTTVQVVASTDTTVAAPAPSGPDLSAVAGPEGKGGCHGLPRPRRDPHADHRRRDLADDLRVPGGEQPESSSSSPGSGRRYRADSRASNAGWICSSNASRRPRSASPHARIAQKTSAKIPARHPASMARSRLLHGRGARALSSASTRRTTAWCSSLATVSDAFSISLPSGSEARALSTRRAYAGPVRCQNSRLGQQVVLEVMNAPRGSSLIVKPSARPTYHVTGDLPPTIRAITSPTTTCRILLNFASSSSNWQPDRYFRVSGRRLRYAPTPMAPSWPLHERTATWRSGRRPSFWRRSASAE